MIPAVSERRTLRQTEYLLIAELIAAKHGAIDCATVTAADFLDPHLGELFTNLAILSAAGYPIQDGGALVRAVRKMPRLPDDMKDPDFIARLLRDGIGSHVRFYAQAVKADATKRGLMGIGHELLGRLEQHEADTAQVTEWLSGAISSLQTHVDHPPEHLSQVARRVASRAQEAKPSGVAMATSGIYSLDELTGAWRAGESIVLAARPGMGKTALAFQVAMHNAQMQRRVLFCSLEMSADEIVTRRMCADSKINGRRIRNGTATPIEVNEFAAASDLYDDTPLIVWAPSRATVGEIRAVARRESVLGGLGLVIVDYCQLVRPTNPKVPREEQVADVSRSIKQLAKELCCPVFLLAQLNRQADIQEPRLSHLRESGSLEQDADGVIFIHAQSADDTERKLICAKNRAGAVGDITVTWDAPSTTFGASVNRENDFDKYNNE